MKISKLKYFIRSASRFFSRKCCPSCGYDKGRIIDTKMMVTKLIECERCRLMYRFPPDSKAFSFDFYSSEYAQNDGITTDLPEDEQLKEWMQNNFTNSVKYESEKIEVLKRLYPSIKDKSIVDYGASWGYTSFQFINEGLSVNAFEISQTRAKFGEKLGLDIITNESSIPRDNDIFFSSHVIEHVPSVSAMIEKSKELLKWDGFYVSFCPNGSEPFKEEKPENFHRFWGEVHPNLLNDVFFCKYFSNNPYFIGSSPIDLNSLSKWVKKPSQVIEGLTNSELVVIAMPNVSIA